MSLTDRLLVCYLLSTVTLRTAAKVIDLSGKGTWTLVNNQLNISIPASVPSHAHLDLLENRVIGDPYYGLNDQSLRWVAWQNWTYVSPILSSFPNYTSSIGTPSTGPQYSHATSQQLRSWIVFYGLDTFATVSLCRQVIATTENQFRQYFYDVTTVLDGCHCEDDKRLEIVFGSAPAIVNAIAALPNQEHWPNAVEIPFEFPNRQFMRKQQSDFGWDWGPAFAPAGPWLPIKLVQLQSGHMFVRNSLVDIYRQGQRNNMVPDQMAPWVLNASLDLIGNLAATTRLEYSIVDVRTNQTLQSGSLSNITRINGAVSGTAIVPASLPKLWWPVGMGEQNLYSVELSLLDAINRTIATEKKRTGFRTIILNELPITNEQLSQGIAPGNNWHFEINGHPFFAKGSNFIPPDAFWPRVTFDRIKQLFNAVVKGNQNMLRVWASGAYSPDFVFDLADEMGILLWTEFEFGDALYPVDQPFLDNVYEEAVYQVRRCNHHPSLAYWAGGNELENLELPTAESSDPESYPRYLQEYEKLFLGTLFPAVFENSRSISYAPSSTSNGFVSLDFTQAPYFQERLDNKTNGSIYGETDYYNYNATIAFDYGSYPVGRFSNEFGFHSMPSLQTWQQVLPSSQLSFNSSFIVSRNHHNPPSSLNIYNNTNSLLGMYQMTAAVETWYPIPLKQDSVKNFSAWCFATQIFQADYYTSQINFYRRGSGLPQRTLGSLYWQLEDIWQAPSWAGIEYDGRWKALHYAAREAYKPVTIAPFYEYSNASLEVWITSDLWSSSHGTATLDWFDWSGQALASQQYKVEIGALNSTCVTTANVTSMFPETSLDDVVMRMRIDATGTRPSFNKTEALSHESWFHASPLKTATLQDPGLVLTHNSTTRLFTVEATMAVSAWTWLDYPAGMVVVFSRNGFWLAKGDKLDISYELETAGTVDGRWTDKVTVMSLFNNTIPT